MKQEASILITDDNASLRKSMSLILKRKGHAVTTAGDGLEAIGKVNQRPFDMIFMDIKMPVMDGVEAYRKIKELRPDAVVVMITAYAVEDLIQEALEEGAYAVLYKPLDFEKLFALIEEARESKNQTLILVVDDHQGIGITLRNILLKEGHKTCVAHNGEEAIAMAKEQAYGIIFIDMKLPTMNGLETYLAIREMNPRVVAIMMTGYRQEMADLVEEALNNHAYTCLYKPLDVKEVARLVEKVLQRRGKGG